MLNQQFKRAIKDIFKKWIVSSPRWKEITELLNYTIVLKDPTNLAVNYKSRKFNYKYNLAELLWYLSWDIRTEFIGQYAKLWSHIADNNGEINSNYGFLMFEKNLFDTTQYDWMLNTLKKDQDSRQAIGYYGWPRCQYKDNKDVVCTSYNHVFIRNNELHMISSMRSNDLIYWMTYDCIYFSLILQSLRLDLLETYPNLKLGKLYYTADSLHIYRDKYDISKKILKEKWYNIHFTLKKSLKELYKSDFVLDLKNNLQKDKDIVYYKKILSNFIKITDNNWSYKKV